MQKAINTSLRDARSEGIDVGITQGKAEGMIDSKMEAYINYGSIVFYENITGLIKGLEQDKWKILEESIYRVKSVNELKQLLS